MTTLSLDDKQTIKKLEKIIVEAWTWKKHSNEQGECTKNQLIDFLARIAVEAYNQGFEDGRRKDEAMEIGKPVGSNK